MENAEEKTEQPTPFKLKQARNRGRVAKSTDIVTLCSFFFTITIIFMAFSKGSYFIQGFMSESFKLNHQLSAQEVLGPLKKALNYWFLLSLPILLAASFGAFFGNITQFGFLFSTHPIKPDIKKISPVAGFKRLFSKDRGIELLKQVFKFFIVFSIIIVTIHASLRNITLLFRASTSHSLIIISDIIFTVIKRVLIAFLFISAADLLWQRFSFLKSMRMSKYEVKKEHKNQEGDPQLKQERKRVHQEVLETQSIDETKNASVVITNPSHLAIALKYEEDSGSAPFLVAKGYGIKAKEIIKLAQYSNVFILRNVPLARDLQWLEINEEIPESLYDSVAEVLTFIQELEMRAKHYENK